MGPTPITATHLAVFRYTADGFQHKAQLFCEAVPSADPSGFDLVGRAALGNPGFSTLADPFFTAIANLFTAADCSFDGAELWARSGSTYVYVTNAVTTVTPALGGYIEKANGFDVVGKDAGNNNLHFYIYEGPFGVATKISSYAAASANVKTLVNYLYNNAGTATITSAWNWRESRGGVRTGRWLAGVIDSNQKLRHMRGIA